MSAPGIKIGYVRCSTEQQDLTAQRHAPLALGVSEDRPYTDHGLSGRNRDRPSLRESLAAHRAGGHMSCELAELFGVARCTSYRTIERAGVAL